MTAAHGSATVIQGDARKLDGIDDASVDLIVTSPPYWALRSYTDTPELCARCRELTGHGREYPSTSDRRRALRQAWPDWDAHVKAEHKATHYDGQIGAEPTPAAYIDSLIECTAEWMRVLKPSGSLFVNLGDKYAGSAPGRRDKDSIRTLDLRAGWRRVTDRRAPEADTFAAPDWGVAPKSLIGLPWRYAIRCIDDLGLILRAEVIWDKPNGMPESVTDRVRRSHETWFHFVKSPRYFAAVDTIREAYSDTPQAVGLRRTRKHYGHESDSHNSTTRGRAVGSTAAYENPLGKMPGSVWEIATQPLKVPAELGIDHFAAYPLEWPRRIIQGWSPSGICTACGEGRRPVRQSEGETPRQALTRVGGTARHNGAGRQGLDFKGSHSVGRVHTIIGEACACPDASAPTRPAVVLDPFGGTGTTALVAKTYGRHGISVDMSADYCRLAEWRVNDPGQIAAAMQVEKPAKEIGGQDDLLSLLGGGAA